MEYIVLWILALFGLWSLITNILESFYNANREGEFDVILSVHNQANSIYVMIKQLSKLDMVGKIRIFDNASNDGTMEVVKEIRKTNSKVVIEE